MAFHGPHVLGVCVTPPTRKVVGSSASRSGCDADAGASRELPASLSFAVVAGLEESRRAGSDYHLVVTGLASLRPSTASWWRKTMISRSLEPPERTAERVIAVRKRYKIRNVELL